MIARLLGALLLTLSLTALLPASEPPVRSTAPGDIKDEAALRETILAEKYRGFEEALLRLAQRLDRSTKPEDRAQAAQLRKAIEVAGKGGISTRFAQLIFVLKKSEANNLNEVKDAIEQGERLIADLQEVLDLLLKDRDLDRTRDRIKRLEELIKMLNLAIRDQKVVRRLTDMKQMEKDELGKSQDKVTKHTDELGRELEKDGIEKLPGKELVQGAVGDQREAGQNIGAGNQGEASKHQSEAIGKLVRVREALEKILQQLRDEERKAILISLKARCEEMQKQQTEILDGTVAVAKKIAAAADQKPTRPDEQQSLALSDREAVVVRHADKVLAILKAEGSSIAFAEVFEQLKADTTLVQRRLNKADVGELTRQVERDIIDTLQEVLDALNEAISPVKPGPGGNPAPPKTSKEPRLIDFVAELKMIRSLQVRVNDRTKVYGQLYRGEQAEAPEIRKELKDLADRQLKIYDVTKTTDKREQETKNDERPGR